MGRPVVGTFGAGDHRVLMHRGINITRANLLVAGESGSVIPKFPIGRHKQYAKLSSLVIFYLFFQKNYQANQARGLLIVRIKGYIQERPIYLYAAP